MKVIERAIDECPGLTKIVDDILPERLKLWIRALLLGEKFPLSDPYNKQVKGRTLRFWINTASDWHRITKEDFEKGFLTDLVELVKPGIIVYDIGSAQGLYSLFAAAFGSEVYAFDPDPISIAAIHANIKLNHTLSESIHVLPMAITNQAATTKIYWDKTGTYAPSLKKTARGLQDSKFVETTAIDNLIKIGNFRKPQIVKIDVEGAEGLVLEGMVDLLSSSDKPLYIFIELHPNFLPQFGFSVNQVINALLEYNYVLFSQRKHRDKLLCQFRAK